MHGLQHHDELGEVLGRGGQLAQVLPGYEHREVQLEMARAVERTLANKGVLLDAKGQYNYARMIGYVKVPIFIACGARDSFAPPVVQRYIYDHVGSTDKTLYIFGRERGQSVDCGHDDALVGLNSKAQTYPVIARWLAGQPPGR